MPDAHKNIIYQRVILAILFTSSCCLLAKNRAPPPNSRMKHAAYVRNKNRIGLSRVKFSSIDTQSSGRIKIRIKITIPFYRYVFFMVGVTRFGAMFVLSRFVRPVLYRVCLCVGSRHRLGASLATSVMSDSCSSIDEDA